MSQVPGKSPAPALVLAFLPAAIVLIVGALGGQSGPAQAVIWAVCAVCLASCFVSSFLLFRRKTGWWIVGGIVFLLLNLAISLFAGCAAVLKGMNL